MQLDGAVLRIPTQKFLTNILFLPTISRRNFVHIFFPIFFQRKTTALFVEKDSFKITPTSKSLERPSKAPSLYFIVDPCELHALWLSMEPVFFLQATQTSFVSHRRQWRQWNVIRTYFLAGWVSYSFSILGYRYSYLSRYFYETFMAYHVTLNRFYVWHTRLRDRFENWGLMEVPICRYFKEIS